MRWLWLLAVFTLLVAPGCRTLPTIDTGVCGNGVVERSAGEDCDRFAVTPGSVCRQPTQSNPCRYDCTQRPDGTRPTCPAGMGCAEDGICRWPSGRFQSNPVTLAAEPRELEVADLDGDRRQDLLVTEQKRVMVRYFGDRASPAGELDIPIAHGPTPVVAELSGDALPDVVVPYAGVTVALGSADRSLVPTGYPSIAAPAQIKDVYLISADVLPTPGDEPLFLGNTENSTLSVLSYVSTTAINLIAAFPYPTASLAGNVAVGNLDEDPVSSPCQELVLPFRGADRLFELSPCKLDSSGTVVINAGVSPAEIVLPAGDRVLGALALVDFNHDGHLDVAVGASNGGDNSIDVAYGVGDGSFNSTAPVPASNGDERAARAASIGKATPLAIGDLDGDGQPDYVDAYGAYLDRSSGFQTVGKSDAEGWSEALITDLNRNGLPDVVAANAHQSGVVFLDGVGQGLLTRFDVPTEGTFSRLAVGDFDGDMLGDIAGVEDTDGGPMVSVLFGSSYGPPDPPRSAGLLDKVVQVVPTRSYLNTVYGLDSIFAVAKSRDGSFAFSAFGGSSNRLLRAPFLAVESSVTGLNVQGRYFAPLRFAAGRFDGDKHGDLAELGELAPGQGPTTSDEFKLWLCPMHHRAAIDLSDPRSGDLLPSDVDWQHSEIAAGDLDRDGKDEIVLFAPAKGASGSRGYVARSFDTGGGHYAWKLGPPVKFDWRFAHTEGQDVLPGDSGGGRALVADLDADGYADVLALARPSGNAPVGLVVFHGDGKAELGKAEVVPATLDGPATAFALIQTDRDPALELALLAGSNVYLADLGKDGSYHVAPQSVAHLDGAALIAAGDFDGDGVQDLALANASSVAVFRGVPGLP